MHEEVTLLWSERIQSIPAEQPLYADNCYVAILLVGLFILVAALADRGNLLGNMLSQFFLPRKRFEEGVKTTSSQYIQLGLFANAFIAAALFLTIYITRRGNYEVEHNYRMLCQLFVALIAAFLLKQEIYKAVNWAFSDKSQVLLWKHNYTNWAIISGLSMYVTTTLTVFLDLCSTAMTILLIVHIILIETCLFFKAFHIFLAKKYGGLQLFIYLCTLEIMPLLVAGKALTQFL